MVLQQNLMEMLLRYKANDKYVYRHSLRALLILDSVRDEGYTQAYNDALAAAREIVEGKRAEKIAFVGKKPPPHIRTLIKHCLHELLVLNNRYRVAWTRNKTVVSLKKIITHNL